MAPPGDVSTLEVRRARLEDKDAVLGISDVIYEGLDYLPALYDSFIKDPNRVCIVGWIGGAAVAFHMFQLVDAGRTAVVQASRISPAYLSSGLWSVFRRHQLLLLQDLPDVTRVALVTRDTDLHTQRQLAGKTGIRLQLSAHAIVYTLEPADVDAFLAREPPGRLALPTLGRVREISRAELLAALCDPGNQARWFPSRRAIFVSEPFRMMHSNFEELCRLEDLFAYTTCDEDDDVDDEAEVEAEAEAARAGRWRHQAVSVVRRIPTAAGTRLDLHYFGATNDIDGTVAHACACLRALLLTARACTSSGAVVPIIYPPPGMSEHLVRNRLRTLLGLDGCQVMPVSVFECAVDDYECGDRKLLIAQGKLTAGTRSDL